MRFVTALAALAALSLATAAQQPAYKRDVPANLLKEAKVSEDSARKIAAAQLPKATLSALELEREKGRLIWSLEFKTAGKSGIDEVNVDAATGAVVSVAHEASGTVTLPGYHVVATYVLGGEGGWDYVVFDSTGHHLFIARSTRVMVVNPDNGTLIAEIPGIGGAHGVAIADDFGHGFATGGRDSSVTMFDLKTLKVLSKTTAAPDADAVLYDPATKRVFSFNGDSKSSSVIDAATGQKIGTVDLGAGPEFGVSAWDGMLYVNL